MGLLEIVDQGPLKDAPFVPALFETVQVAAGEFDEHGGAVITRQLVQAQEVALAKRTVRDVEFHDYVARWCAVRMSAVASGTCST